MAESLPCCGHVRQRKTARRETLVTPGTICEPPETYYTAAKFPICSVYRFGGWHQAAGVAGPYPFDYVSIVPTKFTYDSTYKTAYGPHWMEATSADTWESPVVARVVYNGGMVSPASPTNIVWGVTRYTMTMELTGTGAGGCVITRNTISHPDPDFPPVVTWTNNQALTSPSALQLTLADGTSSLITRHLGKYNSVWGELPCSWDFTGGPKNGLECADLEFTIDGDATAEWAGVRHTTFAFKSGLSPFSTTSPYGATAGEWFLNNTRASSGGYYTDPLLLVGWYATCDGVQVNVKLGAAWDVGPPSYRYYSSGINWRANGLPHDWWTGPVDLDLVDHVDYVPETLTITPCELPTNTGEYLSVYPALYWESWRLAHALDDVMTQYHIKYPSYVIGDSTTREILQWFNAAYVDFADYADGTAALDWFNDKWGL